MSAVDDVVKEALEAGLTVRYRGNTSSDEYLIEFQGDQSLVDAYMDRLLTAAEGTAVEESYPCAAT